MNVAERRQTNLFHDVAAGLKGICPPRSLLPAHCPAHLASLACHRPRANLGALSPPGAARHAARHSDAAAGRGTLCSTRNGRFLTADLPRVSSSTGRKGTKGWLPCLHRLSRPPAPPGLWQSPAAHRWLGGRVCFPAGHLAHGRCGDREPPARVPARMCFQRAHRARDQPARFLRGTARYIRAVDFARHCVVAVVRARTPWGV